MTNSTMIVKDLEDIPLREPVGTHASTKILVDEQNAEHLRVGYMWWQPGSKGDLHYHDVEELQLILYGNGRLTDCDGNQYPLRAGTMFHCPPGKGGAHQIENTSRFPMCLLFIYPKQTFHSERL
jgi:quercetin dioxygenase-like cupin family protein